jgi:hypothetical protein
VGFVESFLNEQFWRAQRILNIPREKHTQEVIDTLAHFGEWAVQARLNIKRKLDLASIAMTHRKYEWGMEPGQSFSLLVDLRNSLMHLKEPESVHMSQDGTVSTRRSRVILALQDKGILPKDKPKVASSCWFLFEEPKLGQWSIDTASAIVRAIQEMLPDDPILKLGAGVPFEEIT